VPTPDRQGKYLVRFELYSDGVLLGYVDSKRSPVWEKYPTEPRSEAKEGRWPG
jgi:hypothetical protein